MFRIHQKSTQSNARVGTISTPHGEIETPAFLPDATRAFVKLLVNDEVSAIGVGPMVVNTLHLYLQPGMSVIKKLGGVHRFMNWNAPLLSDSGGYQVYSLIHRGTGMGLITDEYAEFRSPIDGTRHLLTPEKSIQIQFDLGTDMIVCLDDVPPHNIGGPAMKRSIHRTIEWAQRCRTEYNRQIQKRKISAEERPIFFAVIQGGADTEMRGQCAEALRVIGFDGYGYGARPVDVEGNFLGDVLRYTASVIPEDAIRFALGTGTPEDIVRCVRYGWDLFDCVIPTREGRHGRLFVWTNSPHQESRSKNAGFTIHDSPFYTTLHVETSAFKNDTRPVDPTCDCPLCTSYSRAYMHHLFKVKEPLGARLAAMHNLRFYMRLMDRIRDSIQAEKL